MINCCAKRRRSSMFLITVNRTVELALGSANLFERKDLSF